MVSEASFVIYQSGGAVCAANGLTGETEMADTDAAAVIQRAVDRCELSREPGHVGGSVHVKAGRYELDRAIKLRNGVWLRGEGRGTLLVQNGRDECGLVYVGNNRDQAPGKAGARDRPPDDPYITAFEKYGVTGLSYASLRISDLALMGPGAEGTGDGIHVQWLTTYDGPCIVEGVRVWRFGSWQVYTAYNYGGAFIVRDAKIGSDQVGNGIFIDRCNGGRAESIEIHQLQPGGTGLYLSRSWSFALCNIVSEFAYVGDAPWKGCRGFVIKGWQIGATIQSCYSEQCEYGLVIEGTGDPGGYAGGRDAAAMTITGCHFNNAVPLTIDNAENILVQCNYFDTQPGNYNVLIGENTANVRVEMNTIHRGRGVLSRKRSTGKPDSTAREPDPSE